MPEPGARDDEPVLLREVTLRRRPRVPAAGHPPLLVVRVWATGGRAGGRFELRGEDPAGNIRFSYQDERRLEVLEEFDRTVREFLEEYVADQEAQIGHG